MITGVHELEEYTYLWYKSQLCKKCDSFHSCPFCPPSDTMALGAPSIIILNTILHQSLLSLISQMTFFVFIICHSVPANVCDLRAINLGSDAGICWNTWCRGKPGKQVPCRLTPSAPDCSYKGDVPSSDNLNQPWTWSSCLSWSYYFTLNCQPVAWLLWKEATMILTYSKFQKLNLFFKTLKENLDILFF